MRCRRYDQRYALVIRSNEPLGDWKTEKIRLFMGTTNWSPSADVYETEDNIYLTIELAGVDPEKVEISIYENALVIEGQRKLPPFKQKGTYHIAEILQGPFCFELPLIVTLDASQVHAHYENGLLSIVIKKAYENP